MSDGEKRFNLTKKLKKLCYYNWKTWYKLLSSLRLKKNCVRFYYPPNMVLRGTKYCASLSSNTIKRKELESLYFPEEK